MFDVRIARLGQTFAYPAVSGHPTVILSYEIHQRNTGSNSLKSPKPRRPIQATLMRV